MTEQATQQRVAHVPPVAPSLRMHTLPAVAVKIALGGIAEPMPGGVKFGFEEDVFVLNASDYGIAKRAADRLKAELPRQVTATAFLELHGNAQKYVAGEVFRPGTRRVLYYPSLSEASAFYRCRMPTVYLNRSDRISAHVSAHLSARDAQWYDVIVIQLDFAKATQAFARVLREMGKKIVFEFDDDFESLEPWHPQYEKYRSAETRRDIAAMFGLCDAVTVTTPELARKYADRHDRIEVVPNLVPIDDWPKTTPHGSDEFRILWAGSPSHFGDLETVSEALWSFLRERVRATVVFFGQAPKRVPDDLGERVTTVPFCGFGEYPRRLAEVRADVAIAPLSSNEFNRSKSPVKILEYGACGYPVIASDVGPYRAAAMESAPRIAASLCADGDGWLAALRKYHDEPDFRRWMTENSLEYARSHSTGSRVGGIEEFFASL